MILKIIILMYVLNIIAVISLEASGFFSDTKHSQHHGHEYSQITFGLCQ